MVDPVDRMVEKLEDKIEGTLFQIQGVSQWAGVEGQLLALNAELSMRHLAYMKARGEGKGAIMQREASAISACDQQYDKIMSPPGMLDIQINFG